MSQQLLEDRVGQLEQEQFRQGERLGRVESDVGDIKSGVRQLLDRQTSAEQKALEREASAPHALTWKTIAATCGSIVAVAYVVWWLIGSSPAVVDLSKRLDRLDDPQVGRVPAVERRLDKLDGWQATVRR